MNSEHVSLRAKGEYGIWLVALHGQPVGKWLSFFDVESGDHARTGLVDYTDDPREALRYPSMIEGMRAWQTRSTRVPTRPDGKPNRPLTAFTAEIKRLP